MGTQGAKELSRRQALRHGAVAGAVVWSAPMIISSTAHATNGGSSGAGIDGPVSSVTCKWNQRVWRPNRGTSSTSKNRYTNVGLIEVDGGQGWKTCGFGDSFTVLSGYVLKFRPFQGSTGGRAVGPADPAQTEPTVPPETTVPPESTTTKNEIPTTDTPPVVPSDGTTTVTTEPATITKNPVIPATTAAPSVALQAQAPQEATTETIVIDMSGRTALNVGDVYGLFQIVAAQPA